MWILGTYNYGFDCIHDAIIPGSVGKLYALNLINKWRFKALCENHNIKTMEQMHECLSNYHTIHIQYITLQN